MAGTASRAFMLYASAAVVGLLGLGHPGPAEASGVVEATIAPPIPTATTTAATAPTVPTTTPTSMAGGASGTTPATTIMSGTLTTAPAASLITGTPETCPSRTINYITHTLPQQCLRTAWSSANATMAVADDATGTIVVTMMPSATPEKMESDESTGYSDSSDNDDGQEDLATGSFMSFEEWKMLQLKKAGQDPADLARRRRQQHRSGAGNAQSQADIDSLGDDGEIALDFDVLNEKMSELAAAAAEMPGRGGEGSGGSGGEASDESPLPASATAASDDMAVDSAAAQTYRSKDAGKTSKERFSFASFDAGATVLKTSKGAKNAKAILLENKDSYMLLECNAHDKSVVVELSDDILVDTVVLANFEFFSSMVRRFRVSVSDRYPVKADRWRNLGEYEARNVRGIQPFLIANPQIWARYIRIDFLSHYGNEYYCPISLLRVHGTRMLDSWKESENGRDDDDDEELEYAQEAGVAQPRHERQEKGQQEQEQQEQQEQQQEQQQKEQEQQEQQQKQEHEELQQQEQLQKQQQEQEERLQQQLQQQQQQQKQQQQQPAEPIHSAATFDDDLFEEPSYTPWSPMAYYYSRIFAETCAASLLAASARINHVTPTGNLQPASTASSSSTSSHASSLSSTASNKGAQIPLTSEHASSSSSSPTVDDSGSSDDASKDAANKPSSLRAPPSSSLSAAAPASAEKDTGTAGTPPAPVHGRAESVEAIRLSSTVASAPSVSVPPVKSRPPVDAASAASAAAAAAAAAVSAAASSSSASAGSASPRSGPGAPSSQAGPSGTAATSSISSSPSPPASSFSASSFSSSPPTYSPSASSYSSHSSTPYSSSYSSYSTYSSTGPAAASSSPTVQESFFKSVTKRLQLLESNSTLSLQYIEDQSRFLQDALRKMERKQITRIDGFLDRLNRTVLNELGQMRQQYDQLWQSTVLALEAQREQSQRENVALSDRLNVLADEVVFQKRMAILQSVLLLSCLVLVIFSSRGLAAAAVAVGGGSSMPMSFLDGGGASSPTAASPPTSPTSPLRSFRGFRYGLRSSPSRRNEDRNGSQNGSQNGPQNGVQNGATFTPGGYLPGAAPSTTTGRSSAVSLPANTEKVLPMIPDSPTSPVSLSSRRNGNHDDVPESPQH